MSSRARLPHTRRERTPRQRYERRAAEVDAVTIADEALVGALFETRACRPAKISTSRPLPRRDRGTRARAPHSHATTLFLIDPSSASFTSSAAPEHADEVFDGKDLDRGVCRGAVAPPRCCTPSPRNSSHSPNPSHAHTFQGAEFIFPKIFLRPRGGAPRSARTSVLGIRRRFASRRDCPDDEVALRSMMAEAKRARFVVTT